MSTTSLTKPEAPPASASTKPQLLFLGLGLLSFALLWAAPVALCVWVLGWFFGSVGIAEALERTRGLAPTTYGGAFWLAVVVTVVMAVLEVRAMIRKQPERRSWLLRFITRPSTAYFALILPTVLLVRLDVRGTDVPDILTTTLLLCCLGYVWFILPLAMAAVSWRVTWWMWRKGSGSSFAAGVLGMLGISFASCTPLMCVVEDDEEPAPSVERVGNAFDRGFDRAEGQDAIDGSRALMGALAEVIDNEPARSSRSSSDSTEVSSESTDKDLFGDCVTTLVSGGSSSHKEIQISIFIRRHGFDRITAEQIVQDAVLDLCLRHANPMKSPYANVAAVFNLRADSRRKNWLRNQSSRNRCVIRAQGFYDVPQDELTLESAALDRALCDLDGRDRRILELSALGHDSSTIGQLVGLSKDAVRQRKAQAIKRVRKQLRLQVH